MKTKNEIIASLRRCSKGEACYECVYNNEEADDLDCVTELMADAAKCLEVAGEPEWISVEDRLPEKGGYYLTVVENCEKVCYSRLILDKFGHDGVTHWMPLPEPPKPKVPTFKDVFLKAFPKAPIDEYGNPCCCIDDVFPCTNRPPCDHCSECWNRPYFEPKEEGGADA